MTTATPASEAWPREVWEAPIFRGLDARALAELEAAGRLLHLRSGDRLFAEGAAGSDAFFVVARGEITLLASRQLAGTFVVRHAGPRDLVGEEATVGVPRYATASASKASVVAEIPVHLFKRAVVRVGRGELWDRVERTLRRAMCRDLVADTPLAQSLSEVDLDVLLDAVTVHGFARGQAVYRTGDASTGLFIVGEGLVQLQTESEGKARVLAYLGRGDFFGDEELGHATPRRTSAVANGPSTVLFVPARVVRGLARLDEELFASLRRASVGVRSKQSELIGNAAAHATQHVFRDLYRMQMASSLLVIDLETCVRCGHCAWACASLYGESRLFREGDKVLRKVAAPVDQRASDRPDVFEGLRLFEEKAAKQLLLPNSCQHCENPACMIDCPTGAIAKDQDGEVFIRKELCTGCGACARACPWGNIHMKDRPAEDPRPRGGTFEEVADKCDLCRERPAGPACVSVCPVSAIARIDPKEEWSELAVALGREAVVDEPGGPPRAGAGAGDRPPPRTARTVLLASAAIGALAVFGVGVVRASRGLTVPTDGRGAAAAFFAGGALLLLAAYALGKRAPLLLERRLRRNTARPLGARAYVFHVTLGLAAAAVVPWHAPSFALAPRSLGALLTLFFGLAAASGAALALAYAWLPRGLARLERRPVLPETVTKEREELETRLFKALSGKDDLLKKVAEKVLLPYARAWSSGVRLLLSGRDLQAEERRLEELVIAKLEGRRNDPRLHGLRDLVRLAIDLAVLPVLRAHNGALRGLLPIHVVTMLASIVLLVAHVLTAGLP
jgi:Fe-S-cluster-containing dehydrogenase component/CRP-like cAMP-binding protein